MGIKDLKKTLKDLDIKCFGTVPLSDFASFRIAIDGLNWLFTYISSAVRNLIEKQQEDYLEKKEELKLELLGTSILERPKEKISKYKQLVINTVYIKFSNIDRMKFFGKEIGLPTIFADDEAENLASSLCVERKVAAVWSADTDTYPLGAPVVVKGFEYINGVTHISYVYIPRILKELNLNYSEFRDFCILLGTDFNDRMHGIGPKKSLLLINTYRCIEKIEEETKHNIYCLKYKENRKQLTPYNTYYYGENFLNINKDIDQEAILKKYNFKNTEKIVSAIIKSEECIDVPKNKV